MNTQNVITTTKQNQPLEFTGNWYFDMGILGFTNLMEEVYGFDLEKTKKMIEDDEEITNRFFLAYFYKHAKDKIEEIKGVIYKEINKKPKEEQEKLKKEINETIENLQKYLKDLINQNNIKNIKEENYEQKVTQIKEETKKFLEKIEKQIKIEKKEETKKFLEKIEKQIKKIEKKGAPLSSSYALYFNNFSSFNPGRNIKDIIQVITKPDRQIVLDKTVNLFLYSKTEFSNESYSKLVDTKELEKIVPVKPIFLILSVPWSTVKIENKNAFYYTNSLDITYHIHKKIKQKLMQKENRLLKQTWEQIIDAMFEKKLEFSLENLYIIQYGGIDKQTIKDVEFIPVSKLNAEILLDDKIRGQLLKTKIIEEVLKEKPLYPKILNYAIESINNKKYFDYYSSIYALMIDANKKKLSNEKTHFSQNFFKEYSNLVDDIKRDVNLVSLASNSINECIINKTKEDIYFLLKIIKTNSKNTYLNKVYSMLLESNNEDKKKIVSEYLLKKIISNEQSWKEYALALLLKMVVNLK